MSIEQYDVKEIYTGDGSLSSYTFDFRIVKKEQILIVIVDADGDEFKRLRGTDTSYLSDVTFEPVLGGGTVELLAVLPTGYQIVLLLADDEPTQLFEFKNKTSFTLRLFESALDNIMQAVQRLVYKSKQSFRIHDLDNEETFNTQLPAGIASQADRMIQVNISGDGFDFGPTALEVANSQAYAEAAALSAEAALESETEAELSAIEAQFLLFDGSIDINDLDSPVTLENNTYADKIVFVDADNGDVIINLEAIAGYPLGYKTQFIRSDESANTVTIVPYLAETIDLTSSYLLPKGLTVILSVENETNWRKKFIGLVNGGSSLPIGSTAGEYLEYDGADPLWKSGLFEGFSARYGTALSLASVRDALLWVFNFSYLGPQVSLSASGSGTLREKGTAVTASTLTANVTKRSTLISRIQFFLNGVSINDNNPPAQTGTGSTVYGWTGSFSDNVTFRADVTDTTDGVSGPTTVQSSVNFNFVYPFFWNSGAQDLAVSAIGGKQVVSNSNNRNASFSGTAGQVFYYAYPASYGDLTSIKDENNFEVLGSFTKKTKSWTALDAASVSYTIYELTSPIGVSLSTNFTFIR